MTTATVASTELAEAFRAHPERRYVMFGGKGGLGKTDRKSTRLNSSH